MFNYSVLWHVSTNTTLNVVLAVHLVQSDYKFFLDRGHLCCCAIRSTGGASPFCISVHTMHVSTHLWKCASTRPCILTTLCISSSF